MYSRILRSLPREKAFYFFTSIGNYTGDSGASLKEFLEKICEVDVKSVEFHFHRGDFQKWIDEVLGDKELATKVQALGNLGFSGTMLRNRLYNIVAQRYKELTSGSNVEY